MTEQEQLDSFSQVAQELEQNWIDKGLWAQAYSEAQGIQEATRARYIHLRAEKLDAAERASRGPNGLRDFIVAFGIGIVIFAIIAFVVSNAAD